MITKESLIEDIISENPNMVSYLAEKGIRCIICGETIWGTIENAAKEKGWDDLSIDILIDEMNSLK
jgi:predicted adenine nucleotide alpha hydrolase (AANH) superfamily ATPase